MRTAPAPMFLLSGLVRDNRFKVVLSGEGADELLAGYDLFREAKIRRFWAEQPESTCRPALFERIYPWMPGSSSDFVKAFFGLGLTEVDARDYSHASGGGPPPGPSGSSARRCGRRRPPTTATSTPSYPEAFDRWGPLQQAQYLETTILLSQYLLSSQGDRMAMGHSVEGRFPFLDHRVVEFANQLPPSLKLNGLTEKYLLKEVSREWLPAADQRPAQAALPGADPPRLLQRRRAGLRRGGAVPAGHRGSPATSTPTRWTSSSPSSSGACRWERPTTWPWPASSRPSWSHRQFVSSSRTIPAARRTRRREGRRRASGHPEGSSVPMNREVLRIDAAAETERIVQWMKETMRGFHRSGAVVGISGGIDSSVCLALCRQGVRRRARGAAPAARQGLGPRLGGPGARPGRPLRRHAHPGAHHAGPGGLRLLRAPRRGHRPRVPRVRRRGRLQGEDRPALRPAGRGHAQRVLPDDRHAGRRGEDAPASGRAEFAQIVAASNFKQRSRTNMLYYHAELRNYAVVGTPNKNERDQGFFVKYGDGGYDLAPIAHLYKTQVYQLAAHLDVPEAIQTRTPTTDTYSAPSTQEEFFFRLPYETMDLLWYAQEHGVSVEETARALDMSPGPGAQRLRRLHPQEQDDALPARGSPGHGRPRAPGSRGGLRDHGRPHAGPRAARAERRPARRRRRAGARRRRPDLRRGRGRAPTASPPACATSASRAATASDCSRTTAAPTWRGSSAS